MFTGIVEEIGTVAATAETSRGLSLEVAAVDVLKDAHIGDSVAVNGACFTIVAMTDDDFRVEVVPESIARTNLGRLAVGDRVNLERPMRADGRFDGHIVQGHVDGTGTVEAMAAGTEGDQLLVVSINDDVAPYIVEKGSVTVDGVSLTVFSITDRSFEAALIPHTLAVTTLGHRVKGDIVNLEVDVIAKYVARYIERLSPSSKD